MRKRAFHHRVVLPAFYTTCRLFFLRLYLIPRIFTWFWFFCRVSIYRRYGGDGGIDGGSEIIRHTHGNHFRLCYAMLCYAMLVDVGRSVPMGVVEEGVLCSRKKGNR